MSLGRALQGSGSGLTIPSALAIITTSYPVGPQRNKAVAIFGGTAAVGPVAGLFLGGILGATIGWRWIYYFKALVALLILLSAFLVIPQEPGNRVTGRRIDYVGIVTFTYGIVAIIYYLSEGPIYGWSTLATLAPFLSGLGFLGIFVVVESKIIHPVMPLHIFQSRRLVASCIAILLNAAVMSGMIYFAVLSLELALGYAPLKTALSTVPLGVGALIGIGIELAIMDKVPTKLMTVIGWTLLIASSVWWAQITTTSSYWAVAMPGFVLAGLGITVCWICCQINVVADVTDKDQGLVAAVFNVSVQIGVAFGCAVCNIFANRRNSQVLVPFGELVLPGYRDAFYTCAGMAAVGLVLTLVLAPSRDVRPEALEEEEDTPPAQTLYSANLLAVLDDSDHGSVLLANDAGFGGFGGEKTEVDQAEGDHYPFHSTEK
ncbi:hypothetical protein BG003_009685 [Podila horticola]|nr:hypothetical protein BG003_009685 [Podila horticola]